MRRIALAGTLAAALVLPASASGAVTIGSDLAPEPLAGLGCPGADPCTVTNTVIPGAQILSPVDGVVVRWRVRADNSEMGAMPLGVRLKVVRPLGGPFTGVSTSATTPIQVAGATTYTSPTQQPIKAGEQIALDVDRGNFLVATAQTGMVYARFGASLGDGATATPSLFSAGTVPEVMVNADIEPDADCDGLGDETQDPAVAATCSTARKCKKGFRLKKVKTKKGKRKKRCVKKKRKRRKKGA